MDNNIVRNNNNIGSTYREQQHHIQSSDVVISSIIQNSILSLCSCASHRYVSLYKLTKKEMESIRAPKQIGYIELFNGFTAIIELLKLMISLQLTILL